MTINNKKCFVIIPLQPEFNYFYLYLESYLSNKHHIDVTRADRKFESRAFLEKIIDLIDKSDLILADITKANPNVMYEVGIAHTKKKPVILLTQDHNDNVPTDIKHIEYIHYTLDDHIKLSAELDKAIIGIFSETFEKLYEIGKCYFIDFQKEFPNAKLASFEQFCSLLDEYPDIDKIMEPTFGLPYLLPKVVSNSRNTTIIRNISDYISRNTS